jgi:translation machinery-associated protein 16
VRDEKLEKIAAARRKKDKPYSTSIQLTNRDRELTTTHIVERVAFFQEALKQNGGQPLTLEVIQALIKTYVSRGFRIFRVMLTLD